MKLAVVEFLRLEMKNMEIDTQNIMKVFPTAGKANWDMHSLTATTLSGQCTSHNIRKEDHKVSMYVPLSPTPNMRLLTNIAMTLKISKLGLFLVREIFSCQ